MSQHDLALSFMAETCMQVASRAQRSSVEPAEILRYEEYQKRHGAFYINQDIQNAMEEDDW